MPGEAGTHTGRNKSRASEQGSDVVAKDLHCKSSTNTCFTKDRACLIMTTSKRKYVLLSSAHIGLCIIKRDAARASSKATVFFEASKTEGLKLIQLFMQARGRE